MEELILNVKQNPGVIELNFDEIEAALDKKLEEYKGAVFTEESKTFAKKEVANLRKFKAKFEDARKSVKREWMKPYDDFEKRMKQLTAKIDEPINLINSQIAEFEQKRKAERQEEIRKIYQELIGDMAEYCELGRIYDPKWENATTTLKSIRESISSSVESTRTAVATISGMQSEAVEKALSIYKDSLDMAKAISYINSYEQQKAEIMQRETERRRKEERARRKAQLEQECTRLQTELANLKGFFTGKRRKELEARLAEIETELKKL